eukprot:6482321-Amphidinium_carterae.1
MAASQQTRQEGRVRMCPDSSICASLFLDMNPKPAQQRSEHACQQKGQSVQLDFVSKLWVTATDIMKMSQDDDGKSYFKTMANRPTKRSKELGILLASIANLKEPPKDLGQPVQSELDEFFKTVMSKPMELLTQQLSAFKKAACQWMETSLAASVDALKPWAR